MYIIGKLITLIYFIILLFCIPSISQSYDFIRYDLNTIQNPQSLNNFIQSIKALELSQQQKVNIIHIGDSHIQADFFTGKMRDLLQSRFGHGGRGLIFPAKQADTHNPIDVKTSSSTQWEAKRSVFQKNDLSIGISGMSIRTTSNDASIQLRLTERFGPPPSFDKVTFFFNPDPSFNTFQAFSDKAHVQLLNQGESHATFQISPPLTELDVVVDPIQNGSYAELHGMILENSLRNGILYHMAGVNGTTYFHFNRCKELLPQMKVIAPDLIIVSLGTNEALQRKFILQDLIREANRFMKNLKAEFPNTSVLITTLPDAYMKKSYPNPNGEAARKALIELATQYGFAYWDWYEVMGGKGSMKKWVDEDLGYVDYVHFRQAGYEVQAELLYEAIVSLLGY
ncbi:MAG: GDSL-type esterase/lipase family protein [Bacteroidota bacterium]